MAWNKIDAVQRCIQCIGADKRKTSTGRGARMGVCKGAGDYRDGEERAGTTAGRVGERRVTQASDGDPGFLGRRRWCRYRARRGDMTVMLPCLWSLLIMLVRKCGAVTSTEP